MDDLSFFGKLKKLKQDLKPMTFRQKLVHIWTYYKSALVVLLVIIMGYSLMCTIITNKSTKLLLGGISVNVDLSDAAEDYLGDAYLKKIGTGKSGEAVNFQETTLEALATTKNYEDNYYNLMSIAAWGSAKKLDYMILDDIAMKELIREEALLDLREIFTQEELDAIGDMVVFLTLDEGKVPIAIQLTHTEFIKQNTKVKGVVCLAFSAATDREEACKAVYEYILAWKP